MPGVLGDYERVIQNPWPLLHRGDLVRLASNGPGHIFLLPADTRAASLGRQPATFGRVGYGLGGCVLDVPT